MIKIEQMNKDTVLVNVYGGAGASTYYIPLYGIVSVHLRKHKQYPDKEESAHVNICYSDNQINVAYIDLTDADDLYSYIRTKIEIN